MAEFHWIGILFMNWISIYHFLSFQLIHLLLHEIRYFHLQMEIIIHQKPLLGHFFPSLCKPNLQCTATYGVRSCPSTWRCRKSRKKICVMLELNLKLWKSCKYHKICLDLSKLWVLSVLFKTSSGLRTALWVRIKFISFGGERGKRGRNTW